MNNENELLLLSSILNIDEVKTKFIKLLKQNLNWDYILNKIESQGLSAIFYKHISSIDTDLVPLPDKIIEIKKKFQAQYESNLGKNIILQRELKQILSEFSKEEIEVIVMKGMFLVEYIYKNPALRPMADIDILVKRDDIEKAHNCLLKCGFTLRFSDYLVDFTKFPAEVQYYKQYYHIIILLEMHWHLFIPSSIRGATLSKPDDLISTVWETSEKGEILSEEVNIMSPTILVLFLCLHLCQHYIVDGIWACDLYETFNLFFENINWKLLIDYSKNFRIKNLIFFPLLKIHKMFKLYNAWSYELLNSQDPSLPPEQLLEQNEKRKKILSEIEKVLNEIHPTTIEKLFYDKIISNTKNEFLRGKLTDVLVINSNWKRLKAVFQYFFPSKAYCEEKLNKKLTIKQYIYYIFFKKLS